MEREGFFTVPRVMALAVVLPLALAFLWAAGWFAAESLRVLRNWVAVDAVVADLSKDGIVTFDLPLPSGTARQEADRGDGFSSVKEGDTVSLYVNPADTKQLRRAGAADLWITPAFCGLFALVLGGAAAFMIFSDEGAELRRVRAQFEADRRETERNPPAAPPADDGGIIVLHEPGQSWKANVFWGLLFGLGLAVPPFLASDGSALERYGMVLAGLAWMAFMAYRAVGNFAKTVRIDMAEIVVSTPFGEKRVPLREVKRVTLSDVRKELADLQNLGTPAYKPKPMNTMGRLRLYVLRDGAGRELLRLDSEMTPGSEMIRFLRRMEDSTGRSADRG